MTNQPNGEKEVKSILDKAIEELKIKGYPKNLSDSDRRLRFSVPVMEVVSGPLGYYPGMSKSTIHRYMMSDGSTIVCGCFGCGRSYVEF